MFSHLDSVHELNRCPAAAASSGHWLSPHKLNETFWLVTLHSDNVDYSVQRSILCLHWITYIMAVTNNEITHRKWMDKGGSVSWLFRRFRINKNVHKIAPITTKSSNLKRITIIMRIFGWNHGNHVERFPTRPGNSTQLEPLTRSAYTQTTHIKKPFIFNSPRVVKHSTQCIQCVRIVMWMRCAYISDDEPAVR